MLRQIVKIDQELCVGCGFCISGCHEGTLQRINGKVSFVSDSLCCGCGTCVPQCPMDAIALEEREADPFDEEAVKQNQTSAGSHRLFPFQIKEVAVDEPRLQNAHVLIAADCTNYAYDNIHEEFMHNKVTLVGCSKLEKTTYSEKLAEIFRLNEIISITILRMDVPCCSGTVVAVNNALTKSGKTVRCRTVHIGTDGTIVEEA